MFNLSSVRIVLRSQRMSLCGEIQNSANRVEALCHLPQVIIFSNGRTNDDYGMHSSGQAGEADLTFRSYACPRC